MTYFKSTVTNQIKEILTSNQLARDCDTTLMKVIHDQELKKLNINKNISRSEYFELQKQLPNYQTIERARRKLQEKYPELRGKKYEQRQKFARVFAKELKEVA